MKRLLTFVICLASSSFIQANSLNNSHSTRDTGSLTLPPANQQVYKIPTAKPDTILVPVLNSVPLTSFESTMTRRLDSITKEVPLTYNGYVQGYIDLYTAPGRRDEMGHILGLAKYYFPIYEKAFREMGIPEEIKFLSVIESALNPNAVSRVGATGPWQFMYSTAKDYRLNIDRYVDERRDPIQASYAAAHYLRDAYQEFGDWLLAIASYNCGQSNVERAVSKAGVNDFWAARQYLPAETRGYVPAFIAVSYVMNYFDRHGIIPQACSFSTKTDTVLVNRMISIPAIARVLETDVRVLALLNPSYKRLLINGTAANPRRLVIPQSSSDKYSALYEALNTDASNTDAPIVFSLGEPDKRSKNRPAFHKAKRGETMADIADRFGVDEQDLKAWNHLSGGKLAAGEKVWLSASKRSSKITEKERSTSTFITYKVRPGDTLSAIADKFSGTTIGKIKALNRLKKDALQPGMKLKISRV